MELGFWKCDQNNKKKTDNNNNNNNNNNNKKNNNNNNTYSNHMSQSKRESTFKEPHFQQREKNFSMNK